MSRRGKKSAELLGIDLNMECVDEELSPAQKAYYSKNENDYKEITTKLDHMIKTCGAEVVEQASEQVYVLQMNSTGSVPPLTSLTNLNTSAPNTVGTRLQTPAAGNLQSKLGTALTQAGMSTRSNSVHQAGGTYQLMVDPKLGLVVGALTNQPTQQQGWQTAQVVQKAAPPPAKQTTVHKPTLAPPPGRPNLRTPPSRALSKPSPTSTAPMVALPGKGITMLTPPPAVPVLEGRRSRGRPPNSSLSASTAPIVIAGPSKILSAPKTGMLASMNLTKPTENSAVGGLVAGSAGVKAWKPTVAPIVDLTNNGSHVRQGGGNVPDSREMLFNKLSGKTFPSLVVVARPHLRVKDLPSSVVTAGRTSLDAKVKSVLMFTPTKFTEWLIQQGYVRSDQVCTTHVTPDMQPVKLKLGMYSDVSKFPYSGGYVWISECCPQRFVSVFSGSIFEGAPHPPTILLKLMYHWSAQTNVQNVVQWVKVDNFYVKNFFTNMRSICTSAVHEKYEKMGGARKRVEVGVISLGTTSQDGNMRQVKVEVLGVMEPDSKLVRLRAVEPLQDGEKNYKRRFVKILEPLAEWVHQDSIILTDFTVDKGTLHNMGFSSVYQVSASESNAPPTNNQYSNSNVMEYLRRIVPRMFQLLGIFENLSNVRPVPSQNTLSLLSRQIIQQFLDELVWRERWGPVPSQCFDNILLHLSEQTKLDSAESLQTRLSKIASNPFKCWNYRSGLTQRAANAAAAAAQTAPVEPVRTGIDLLPQSIRNVDAQPGPSSRTSKGGLKRGRKRVAGSEATPSPLPKKAVVSIQPAPQPPQVGDDQATIDAFYYGTMASNPQSIKKEAKWSTFAKCCLCAEQFNNNIKLMTHLVAHAHNTDTVVTFLDDPDICRFCLLAFTEAGALDAHVEEVHQSPPAGMPVCRICDTTFADKETLVNHMHGTHVQTELPYECGVCSFRSSEHRDVIQHFYSTHDGSEMMQCALCLKVLPASSAGKPAIASHHWFYQHVQKHLRNYVVDKCTRCKLSFVAKERTLKPHLDRDHLTYRDQAGVRAFQISSGASGSSTSGIGASGPSGSGRQMVVIPADVSTKYQSPHLAKTVQKLRLFTRLDIATIGEKDVCSECNGSMLDTGHFINSLKCTKCRYTTSCSKAMPKHMHQFHTKASKATVLEKPDLPHEMHCVCGFRSNIGNQLAKHMALCERKTAYVSRASACQSTRKTNSASFPPLVTLDDSAGEDPTDRWLKAFAPSRKDEADDSSKKPGAPPSMLNMLGLVRKPSIDDLPSAQQDSDSVEHFPDVAVNKDVKPVIMDDDLEQLDIKVPHEELHLIDEEPGPFDDTSASTDPIADDPASAEPPASDLEKVTSTTAELESHKTSVTKRPRLVTAAGVAIESPKEDIAALGADSLAETVTSDVPLLEPVNVDLVLDESPVVCPASAESVRAEESVDRPVPGKDCIAAVVDDPGAMDQG